MKDKMRIVYGLTTTIVIFAISIVTGSKIKLNVNFIPSSFLTHSTMLLLSIFVTYCFRKYVDYKISIPEFKEIFKPILLGILVTIIVNIFMLLITKIFGNNIESHPLLSEMTPIQTFIFVFLYASIAEEILFRGFLLNILKPLSVKGIIIFKRKVSISVIISALTFGLSHLILTTTGVGVLFLLRIVLFTTILGLLAGYYQEKYYNNAFAIIVHMAGNIMGVISSILININA